MRALAIAALLLPALAEAATCSARSGPQTTALVEYTSEGCSSCPPADRWLSSLAQRYPADRVVPLALYVDYWDYIGWKDPHARRELSQRQRRLSHQQRLALVYRPQVLLQGTDFRLWGGTEVDRAVERINASPAKASLALEILGRTAEALRVRVDAGLSAPEPAASLYLATYESRLANRVTVALEWKGPHDLGRHELTLALLPKAKPADSGVVAFVQNRRTAEVLQALMLGTCSL